MTASQEVTPTSEQTQAYHEDLLRKAMLGELDDDFDIDGHMSMLHEIYPHDYPYPHDQSD